MERGIGGCEQRKQESWEREVGGNVREEERRESGTTATQRGGSKAVRGRKVAATNNKPGARQEGGAKLVTIGENRSTG